MVFSSARSLLCWHDPVVLLILSKAVCRWPVVQHCCLTASHILLRSLLCGFKDWSGFLVVFVLMLELFGVGGCGHRLALPAVRGVYSCESGFRYWQGVVVVYCFMFSTCSVWLVVGIGVRFSRRIACSCAKGCVFYVLVAGRRLMQ